MGWQNTTPSGIPFSKENSLQQAFQNGNSLSDTVATYFPLPAKTGACHAPVPADKEKTFVLIATVKLVRPETLSHHRKSGNTPRLSRYSCRACSRSSGVGAVLYFAYSSHRTSASNFCSNPWRISSAQSSSYDCFLLGTL